MATCGLNICKYVLFTNLIVFIIILINYNSEIKIFAVQYGYIPNKLIMERLKSHARYFGQSPSPCNVTGYLDSAQTKHMDRIVKLLKEFRDQIKPTYTESEFHGRGIVLTVGMRQLPLTKVNLKMIERTGTRLPVQLWYSSSELSETIVTELLHNTSKLDISACSFITTQCRTITKTWNLSTSYVFPPQNAQQRYGKRFPFKPAAILSATFAEVLFLDGDSYLVRDPEYLFQSDPMYQHFGVLFFPDAYVSRQPSSIWQLLNTTCGHDEVELDSGALLVNKRRVWDALYVTKLINDQSEIFYQLFSDGDKDTFRLAFRFLHVPYYIVGILCSTGKFDGNHFCGYSMCKTDSLGRHIYINHVSLLKYLYTGYSSSHFHYTRIGLADPYNHSFYIQYCGFGGEFKCLLVESKLRLNNLHKRCVHLKVGLNEIDDHSYGPDEPLMLESSQNERMLLSKTDHLMPGFVDALLYYRQQVYGGRWNQSFEK